MKKTLTITSLLAMFPLAASAAVISLTGDTTITTNVRPDQGLSTGTGGDATSYKAEQLLALTNDGFAYDPLNPTSASPANSAVGNYFHGSDQTTSDSDPDIIAFNFDGTYNTIFIDIWGRNGSGTIQARDNNFTVTLYLGGTLQETITGGNIPGTLYQRLTATPGTQADSIRITDNTAASNPFSLREIRVNGVPEPSSAALLGLAGLTLLMRRRK